MNHHLNLLSVIDQFLDHDVGIDITSCFLFFQIVFKNTDNMILILCYIEKKNYSLFGSYFLK